MNRFCASTWIVFCLMALAFLAGCSSDDETTPPPQDKTPPSITGHFPELDATDVSRIGPFWIAFNEAMNETTVEAGLALSPQFSCNLFWREDTLFITPTILLGGGASYTITIDATCEDLGGNELGTDYPISFTTTSTNDYVAPEVVGTAPADGALNVNGLAMIEITFNEPMNPSNAESAVQAVPPLHDVWFEWEALTMKVHHVPFPPDSLITITIGTEATDLTGNPLAAPYVFSFRTMIDDAAPYLMSALPMNGANSVSTSLSQIVFNFSEPMDMGSFDFPAEYIDARVSQLVRTEPEFSEDYSRITVTLSKTLLPGCTYWVNFWNATDGAGNVIVPNPTPYEFTTAGSQTLYPIINDAAWYYLRGWGSEATRLIGNYNLQGGTFDEVRLDEHSYIEEKVHLRKTSSVIQHLGRSEYDEDGVFEFSMMWNDPIPYIKLPIESYLGQSWTFATTGTINDSTSIVLSGHIELDAARVDLVSEELRGTFKGCCVHHMYADFTISVNGNPVDSGDVHQIMWLAPGVGPVQIVNSDSGGSDTLRVVDWNL
ncbi:MAG: Ig-like domain-containing protein [Candidatus Krumholzibacteriia bacterium]